MKYSTKKTIASTSKIMINSMSQCFPLLIVDPTCLVINAYDIEGKSYGPDFMNK